MHATLRFVWLAALRDRFLLALATLVSLAILAGLALGQAALVETRATAVVFAATATRLLVVVGMLAFVCFHVQRLIDSREIEAALARPVGRGRFVLAYALAYGALAGLLALLSAAALALLAPPSWWGLLLWGGSLVLEALIAVALALTVALVMNSAVVAFLAALSIYVLGRLMGFFLAVAGGEFGLASTDGLAGQWAHGLMQGLAVLVPRLDLFSQTAWLVYGPSGGIGAAWFVAQALCYLPLLLLLATVDLRSREF